MDMQPQDFAPMPMPRRDIPQLDVSRYKIYLNAKQFVEVEAGSAMEAMRVAKVKEPFKVMRDMPLHNALLARSWLGIGGQSREEAPAAAVETAAETPQEALPATSSAVETAPVEEGKLSPDEVNKLLEG